MNKFFSSAVSAVTLGAASLAASASAMAFDATSIQTAITDNTGTAVLLIGAFILGVWTLRSMGLLKRG